MENTFNYSNQTVQRPGIIKGLEVTITGPKRVGGRVTTGVTVLRRFPEDTYQSGEAFEYATSATEKYPAHTVAVRPYSQNVTITETIHALD